MTKTSLAKITRRQQQILTLIYKYRYLNRVQIQTFMGHKDKQPINAWLRDLKSKGYLKWRNYETIEERNKPAVYFSGLGAIAFYKTLDYADQKVIKRLYREDSRSRAFMEKSMLIADIAIEISKHTEWGTYQTRTQSLPIKRSSPLYNLQYFYGLYPDLIWSNDNDIIHYIVFVIQGTLPRFKLKSMIEEMKKAQDDKSEIFPWFAIICASQQQLKVAKNLASKIFDHDDSYEMFFTLRTANNVKKYGLLKKQPDVFIRGITRRL